MMNVSVAESTGYTNEEGRKVRVIGDIPVRRIDQEYPEYMTVISLTPKFRFWAKFRNDFGIDNVIGKG